MKAAASLLLGLAFVFALAVTVKAEDKEVTLKGKITCAKCDLGKEKKCATVIVTKEDDKEVVYYFDAKGDKKHHKTICQEAKNGTVKGKVEEKDGKKTVTVESVEFE